MDAHQPARILCLDDEPMQLALRKAVLEHAGFVVLTASSGDEALQKVGTEPIDLIISDYLLQGTTGTRVAEFMKLMHPEIPILILSGSIEAPEDMEFADCFLCKTEPIPVILATINKLLNQASASASV